MMIRQTKQINWKTGEVTIASGEVIPDGARAYCVRDHILVADFDYRDPANDLEDIETGHHIAALDEMPALTRSLMESTDWFVELDEWYRVTKVVRRRNPELMQGSDPDDLGDEDEASPDDAMARGRCDQLSSLGTSAPVHQEGDEVSEDEPSEDGDAVTVGKVSEGWRPPRERWDLVYVDDMNLDPERRLQFSAPIFPAVRWKNSQTGMATVTVEKKEKVLTRVGRGGKCFMVAQERVAQEERPWLLNGQPISRRDLFRRLEQAILFSKDLPSGRWLFERCQGLTPLSRKRIWTMWWIEKAKRFGPEAVKGHKVQQASPLRHKPLTAEERLAIIDRRAREIREEIRRSGVHTTNEEA